MREQPIRPNPCACGAKYALAPGGVELRCEGPLHWVECSVCGRHTNPLICRGNQRDCARESVREWNAGKIHK